MIELADLPGHPARAIARRHKALLEAHLAQLLARAGIDRACDLAREIWLLSEGAISMMLVHGDAKYSEAAARVAKALLRDRRRAGRMRFAVHGAGRSADKSKAVPK